MPGADAIRFIQQYTEFGLKEKIPLTGFTIIDSLTISALPDIFSDYGYVAARALDEALKMTDGNTSDKDKLAEAMSKLKFDAPRGPFRMDPVVHNPIQDIHICQVVESQGRVTSKVLTTVKDVQDPGKKIY